MIWCIYISTTKSVQAFSPVNFISTKLTNRLGKHSRVLFYCYLSNFGSFLTRRRRLKMLLKYLFVDKFNAEDTLQSTAIKMAQLIITVLKKKVSSLISSHYNWNCAFIYHMSWGYSISDETLLGRVYTLISRQIK